MPGAEPGRVSPVPAKSLFYFWRITLNPAVNRGVVDIDTMFDQHFLQPTVAYAVFAVPAHRPQNDVTLKMPAFEWVYVLLHQQKGMISLSPPDFCNSAHPTPDAALRSGRPITSHINTTASRFWSVVSTFAQGPPETLPYRAWLRQAAS